ncbi:MAG: LPS export ABC transporter periplasmic protein LptC, partial [Acidobacteriaceae bacterium]|nr:LPS export ABC transporter periplasmic protein LptC [Acidobacteriaceae bacterium]
EKARHARVAPAPQIAVGYDAKSPNGWRYDKDDPQSGKPIVRLRADSAQATHDPSTLEIHGLGLRLYDKNASSYTYVRCEKGFFDERSGLLKSDGEVSIVMNVPADKEDDNKSELAKRVRVTTSGVTYETKTGKATTDQAASFLFTKGDGQAVGVEYDPNTKILHLKSKIALDWIGDGPPENKMHIESADLVYKETEQKIYLSPSATMHRQTTSITAQNPVVTLQDGHLQQIVGEHAFGTDDRDERHTSYSGDKMTAIFDEDGNLVNIVGESNAKVQSKQPGSETTLTGDKADLRFAVSKKQVDGKEQDSSDLHLVLADGHAVAESIPQPQPGVQLAETRILRSEHIELEMKPGGQDVQEIRTSAQAQLEFKPNRPEQSHRVIDASRLRVLYGDGSYVDTFLAWNAATHTDKPASTAGVKAAPAQDAAPQDPQPPALTWSDQLVAKFTPGSNQVATVEQTGNFRYEEGVRKAWAKKAFLEQTINRITLTDSARVLDDTGSAIADQIVMDQANGDMDATGHVFSTHAPNKNQKPGTSMLDDTKTMEAQADKMRTRENNTKVHYEGHAVMWQGANRISAHEIDVDRDAQSLHAIGDVVCELVDNKSNNESPPENGSRNTTAEAKQGHTQPATPPVFTVVRAPELFYRDDTRVADYIGGVKLTREKMTVNAKEVLAYLNPKNGDNKDESSLDHVFANGSVNIQSVAEDKRTRTGTSEHCEYYTKQNKVILNGGAPQMVDSYKGITKGRQLTYYDDDDRLVVEGEKKQLAYTQMKKK